MTPDSIKIFVDAFSRLPGLGPRAATRLAFFITAQNPHIKENLAYALTNLDQIDTCPKCQFVKNIGRDCPICSDTRRDTQTIVIVEKPTNLITIEKSGEHKGMYLVLGELPNTGLLDEKQKQLLNQLKNRIQKDHEGSIKEIIVAASHSTLGDILFNAIKKELADHAENITRLGRGIPTGGDIEFADPETLRDALRRRL